MSVNPFAVPYAGPVAQADYNFNPNQPLPGVIADSGDARKIITGVASVTATGNFSGLTGNYMVFGTLAVVDSSVVFAEPNIGSGPQDGQGCKPPAASGDVTGGVLGIVVRTGAMESRRDSLPPSYAPGIPVNILRLGVAWTASEVAVTKHDAVYVRITANGALNTLGALRNDSDGGNAVLVAGAKWADTQSTPGAPARIECNFMGL